MSYVKTQPSLLGNGMISPTRPTASRPASLSTKVTAKYKTYQATLQYYNNSTKIPSICMENSS